MAGTTVTFREFSASLTKLEKTELRAAAVRGLRWAALRGKNHLITNLIPAQQPPPVDKGLYRAAWNVQELPDGALLHNDELHALFVEYGVRAEHVKIGRAMIEALTEWALRKGIAPDAKAAVGIAWAVAQQAKRRGIFNRPGGPPKGGLGILDQLVTHHLPWFVRTEVTREIEKAMKATLEGK